MKKLLLAGAVLLCLAGHASAQQNSDPCQSNAKTTAPISQATSTTLLSGAAARKNYVCGIVIIGSDAENVSLIEGSGAGCAASPLALIGNLTAASGMNLPANGGFALGNGGATVAAGSNANFNVCLLQSGTGTVGGVLIYVQQ